MELRRIAPYVALVALLAAAVVSSAYAAPPADLERGRYLVKISGCNDCHTPGYPQAGGKVPESEWLTGVPVGFQGPWGTTYPANLRLLFAQMTEKQWMARARTELRPPMPWFALRDMSDADLRAVYRYVNSLGPKGEPAPAYAGPDQKVATPYIVFVPQNLPKSAALK